MFALDTNTLIYYFKGMGRVAEKLAGVAPADIGIPIVVVYELETGIAKSQQPKKRREQLEKLLNVTSILPFDREAARQSAVLRAAMESRGTPLGPIDSLIAGIALASKAGLVTRNVTEFGRVPGLRVIDWY